MSLLIKALEQAARDRKTTRVEPPVSSSESGGTTAEPTIEPPPPPRLRAATPRQDEAPAAETASASPAALTPQPPKAASASAAAPLGFERPVARKPASGTLADLARIDAQQQRARAASVLEAAGGSAATAVAFLRANPVIAIGAAAVVFGIGFGLYVYLQLAHPGLFVASPSSPTTAQAAPPPAQPSAPPAAVAPAPSTPSSPAVTSTGSGPAPGNTTSAAPTAGTIAAPATDSARPSGNTPGPVPAAAVIAAPRGTEPSSVEPPRVTAEPTRDRAATKAENTAASKPSPAKTTPPTTEPAAQTRERIEVSATNAQPRLNPMLAQAYSLMQAGKVEDARALYTKVTQAEPLSIDALLGLAYIAGKEHRTDEATQLYVRILQLNPRHALAQANLIALMGRADPGASETRLKQLIAREPSAFLHFVLGNVYAEQSQWSQAQQSYFQAHHLEPSNPDYAYNLAVGLDHLRQAKLALNYYRRAAELAGPQGRGNFSLDHVRERISALAAQLE